MRALISPIVSLTLCFALAAPQLYITSAVAQTSSDKLKTQASKALKDGELLKASELFYAVFKSNRKPPFLFNAARAAQRAALNLEGDAKIKALKTAKKYYFDYVALPDSGAAGRKRAALYLREAEQLLNLLERANRQTTPSPVVGSAPQSAAKPAARPSQAPAAPQPAVTKQASAPSAWHAPAAIASGVLSLAFAGWATANGLSISSDQDALDADVNGADASMVYRDYKEQQTALNDRRATLRILIGASVASAALGVTFWALRDKPKDRSSLSLEVGVQSLMVRF